VGRSLVFLMVMASIASSQWLEQTDWSGGPGMMQPSWWWDDRFQESEGIDWSSVPGEITLQYSPAQAIGQASVLPRREDDSCSGTLVSGMAWIPMGTDWEIEWGDILWEADEPEGSELYFRLRTGDDPSSMGAWSDPIYESGTYLGDVLPDTVLLIQYLACLQSDSFDPDSWPVLYEVIVEGWYPGGIPGSPQDSPDPVLQVETNPGHGSASIRVCSEADMPGELEIFDLSGRFVVGFTVAGSSGMDEVFEFSAPPGTYVARFVIGTVESNSVFVLIEP